LRDVEVVVVMNAGTTDIEKDIINKSKTNA